MFTTTATAFTKRVVVVASAGSEIDWGDGSPIQIVSNGNSLNAHLYVNDGVYNCTLRVLGTNNRITISGNALTSMDKWSDDYTAPRIAFYEGSEFTTSLTTVPATAPVGVTDMTSMFRTASAFNSDISGWDVSSVTNTNSMFYDANAFNSDISGWDVSSVTNMGSMFRGATAFNSDISGWDMSSVTTTNGMFYSAVAFNGDISGWDVSNVTNMGAMFYDARVFNQDISGWDVSKSINMGNMFQNALLFNQNLSGWCVSGIPSTPTNFALNTPAWTLPKPVWGTCP